MKAVKQLGEGWNWRDLKVGDKFVTFGRTLFEADLLNFVTLCGFSEELFTNKEYIARHAPMRALARSHAGTLPRRDRSGSQT